MLKSYEDVEKLVKLILQIDELGKDFSELSKKKPVDAVNPFKLKLINSMLIIANEFMDDKYRPFSNFTVLEEDDIPTNSDALTILNQYSICLRNFASDQTKQYSGGNVYWIVEKEDSKYPLDYETRDLLSTRKK